MVDALRFHRRDGRTLTFHLGARVLVIEALEHGGSSIEVDVSFGGLGSDRTARAYDVKETPAEVEALLEARAESAKAAYRKHAEEQAKRHTDQRIGVIRQMPSPGFGEPSDLVEDFDFDPMTMGINTRGGGFA